MTDRWEILEAATVTSAEIYQLHMQAFVEKFIEKQRQERWLHLLIERPKSVFKHSHKLHNDLNRNFCTPTKNTAEIMLGQTGVYYDFYDQPRNLTIEQATEISVAHDAIFSIKPGKLALYLFHESEVWLCQK